MEKETIGIVGAGAMGSGIAQVAVEAGHPVILYDAYPEALERSRKKFNSLMERLIAKGKRTEEEVASNTERLRYEADFSALKGADWVIEAAVEDMEIKKDIFARLERNCHADCVLATNTSSLSVSGIASACEDPSRVMGLHFFNPAPLMALVE
ncbi:MAG: NAD(P)-binding domain-containing protein, partial [Bacteroidetes bacterium]|nr:NAD(P)-binding domain-containing protein [Bacteroidota bacterium]